MYYQLYKSHYVKLFSKKLLLFSFQTQASTMCSAVCVCRVANSSKYQNLAVIDQWQRKPSKCKKKSHSDAG
jgi:hypothetical protein